jgi:hypothetical protein
MTLSSLRVEFPYGNLKIVLFLRKPLICQRHRLELALKKNYSFSFMAKECRSPTMALARLAHQSCWYKNQTRLN